MRPKFLDAFLIKLFESQVTDIQLADIPKMTGTLGLCSSVLEHDFESCVDYRTGCIHFG